MVAPSGVDEEDTMLEEFKTFAMKGNAVDLAIGVIIGAAFGKIVESIVGDLVMPVMGTLAHGLDFSNYFLPLSKSVTAAAPPTPRNRVRCSLGATLSPCSSIS